MPFPADPQVSSIALEPQPVAVTVTGWDPAGMLHHALFDLGVLGLTAELRIRVSSLYVARSDAGRRAVDDLSGQPLLAPRPGQPIVEVNHVDWHHRRSSRGRRRGRLRADGFRLAGAGRHRGHGQHFRGGHLAGEALDEDRAPEEESAHGGDRPPSCGTSAQPGFHWRRGFALSVVNVTGHLPAPRRWGRGCQGEACS